MKYTSHGSQTYDDSWTFCIILLRAAKIMSSLRFCNRR